MPLCDDEQLREIALEDITGRDPTKDGHVLWRSSASGRGEATVEVEYFEQGQSADAMVNLSTLERLYSSHQLSATAESDRSNAFVGTFRLDELPTDGSVLLNGDDDRIVDVAEMDQQLAHDACTPSRLEKAFHLVARVLFAFGVIATVPVLLTHRRQRRRVDVRSG